MHHNNSKANTGSFLQPPKLRYHGKMIPNSKIKGKAKRRPKQATVSLISFLEKAPITCKVPAGSKLNTADAKVMKCDPYYTIKKSNRLV